MNTLRSLLTFALLLVLKGFSRVFVRLELGWVGTPPPDPWGDVRLAAILNHTSLYEWVFASRVPLRFLWRIARHTVVPIADKTADRPLVGRFFKLMVRHPVPITRQRDHTWRAVLEKIDDPDAMVIILPEGRMMRRGGHDLEGKPMTVRGGIADLLLGLPEGRFLIAYSGGLHQIHAPGDRLPRPFRKVRLRLENLDLAAYRERLLAEAGEEGFRQAVIDDLTRRRDLHCQPAGD